MVLENFLMLEFAETSPGYQVQKKGRPPVDQAPAEGRSISAANRHGALAVAVQEIDPKPEYLESETAMPSKVPPRESPSGGRSIGPDQCKSVLSRHRILRGDWHICSRSDPTYISM